MIFEITQMYSFDTLLYSLYTLVYSLYTLTYSLYTPYSIYFRMDIFSNEPGPIFCPPPK